MDPKRARAGTDSRGLAAGDPGVITSSFLPNGGGGGGEGGKFSDNAQGRPETLHVRTSFFQQKSRFDNRGVCRPAKGSVLSGDGESL